MPHDAFDGTTQHRLHDLAKVEAERLRRQALRDFGHAVAGDFWRGADVVCQRCLEASYTLAARSASHLQAWLARRASGRWQHSPGGLNAPTAVSMLSKL